jgi:putative ABC transport system permease protein
MASIALRKVGRDLCLARGRSLTMIVATSVSIIALGGVLVAYGILAREMPRSFLETNPASATLVMAHGIDDALLAAVRARPGIADAQARTMVQARVEVAADRWLPLKLFVVEDFGDMRIETLTRLQGAWPPPTGTLLVERTALPLLNTADGASLNVQSPQGEPRPMRVSGVVSDAALAPAWQEQMGYAYITPATLAWLGETPDLEQLKITVSDDPFSRPAITATARDLGAWLGDQGRTVEEIRIPPPGEHPHQRLNNALVAVLLFFSFLLLGLSAVVVATLISGMLSRHVRQIGAMKAVGAMATQIGAMYALLVLVLGAAAVVLSVPLSVVAGVWLAATMADLSNITLADTAAPGWVYLVEVLVGLFMPLLAAADPIVRASTMTVREAVSEISLYAAPSRAASSAGRWVASVAGPTLVLALRNAFRRQGRLALSLGLLAVGGGTFMAGLNVAAASDSRLAAAEAVRTFDMDLQLSRPQPTERLLTIVRSVPGIEYAEPLGFAMVTPVEEGEVPLGTTHKDGGHGNMAMWALAPDTSFPNQLLAGRDLRPDDMNAIVVGQGTLEALRTTIDGSVLLAHDGNTTRWQVVGVVRGFGVAETAGIFTTQAGFANAMNQVGLTQGLRVVAQGRDAGGRDQAMRAVEGALRASGMPIAEDTQTDRLNTLLRNHVAIVQLALQMLGLVMGAVGAFTLASALSTSVAERTREFGVMQTLGATPLRVVAIVVSEGTFVGALSWIGALAVGSVLSYVLGMLVGQFLFNAPLPVVIAPLGLGASLAIALLASALAGVYPATAAARLTIRETLAYT